MARQSLDGAAASTDPQQAQLTPFQEFEATGSARGSHLCRFEQFSKYLGGYEGSKDFALLSDDFDVAGYTWRVAVRPFGQRFKDPISEYVAVFLELSPVTFLPPQTWPQAKYTFVLENRGNTNHSIVQKSEHKFEADNFAWGFPSFVKRAVLLEKKREFMPNNDALHLRVELEVSIKTPSDLNGKRGPDWVTGDDQVHERKVKSCKKGPTVTLKLSGPTRDLFRLSPAATDVMLTHSSTSQQPNVLNGTDEAAGTVVFIAVADADLQPFSTLSALRTAVKDEVPGVLAVPSTRQPFGAWLLLELLACVRELCAGERRFKAYLEQPRVVASEVLLAADYYGHSEAVTALSKHVRDALPDAPCISVPGGKVSFRTEEISELSSQTLVKVLRSNEQAVRLLLSPAALAAWFQSQSKSMVDLMSISLDLAQLLIVLDALHLMPDLDFVRLNCAKIDAQQCFAALARGFRNMARKGCIRRLHIKTPRLDLKLRNTPAGEHEKFVAMSLVCVVSYLHGTLCELCVVAERRCSKDCGRATAHRSGICWDCAGVADQEARKTEKPSGSLNAQCKDVLQQQAKDMLCLERLVWNGAPIEFG